MKRCILYIGGFGRSGSTILSTMVEARLPPVHLGEICHLWHRATREDFHLCGCGVLLQDCPFWTVVIERTLDLLTLDPEVSGALRHGSRRARIEYVAACKVAAFQAVASPPWAAWWGHRAPARIVDYARALDALYTVLFEVTGGAMLLDSSKRQEYLRYLVRLGWLDVALVHLVRDPRACVISRQRKRARHRNGRIVCRPTTLVADAVRWSAQNRALARMAEEEGLSSYRLMRYEDFVSDPPGALDSVAALISAPRQRPGEPADTIRLRSSHVVAGNNRIRLGDGEVVVRRDDRWKTQIRASDAALIELLAGSTMRSYGYRRWR